MKYRIVNGSVAYGAETVLEEINFEINNKEKVAIVGRNGSGKSTFLNALINNEMLSEGVGEDKFSIYKEGVLEIGYLKQSHFEDESITMLDEILKVYKELIDLEKKQVKLVELMNINPSDETAFEISKCQDRYEFLGGYTYKKEYETAINKFGFTESDKYKLLSEFSGGQRTKISFIKLLLSKPELLLLDEPTNHLDIDAIEWLETYIKNYPKAVVIVSHDRMFINKVVDKIYEIEYGQMTEYSGNYEFFEKQKRINYEKQLKDFEFQQKEIKRLERIADRFRYKPTKAKMALSKLKQIERMVKVEEPNKYDVSSFRTNFKVSKVTGNNVLHVDNLRIGYESKNLPIVSFDLYKGNTLGVIGSNGTGKSTLLKTLVGKVKSLGGSITFGTNVEIGYFDQQMDDLDLNKTVFDEFYDTFPELTVTEVRNSLAAFMFYGEDVFKKIEMLSGGEKVRLELAKILKRGPNLLILDEPTNHVDMIGKESLENLLKEYDGTIIVVSHDRYFINKISDCILSFENGEVKYYPYGYEYYLEKKQEHENIKVEVINKQKESIKKVYNNPLKERQKAEKKAEKLELKLGELENEISKFQEMLLKEEIYTNYQEVEKIQNEINNLNMQMEQVMLVWEEMQNIIEELKDV